MKIRDEVIAKIASINVEKSAKVLALEMEAASRIAELQALLDANEAWLQRDTDKFQTKVNQIVALLRK